MVREMVSRGKMATGCERHPQLGGRKAFYLCVKRILNGNTLCGSNASGLA